MKKQILSTFFILCVSLLSQKLFAQDFPNKGILAIQKDNLVSFKKEFKAQDYNKCYALKADEYTPFTFAIRFDKKQIFSHLMSSKPEINKQCSGVSPLMIAAKYNRIDIVKTLLAAGADKNLKNKDGKTALDIATARNFSELSAILK